MRNLGLKKPTILSDKTSVYSKAKFTVTNEFDMFVGVPSLPAQKLLEKYSAIRGAFMTAHNPFGCVVSPKENSYQTDRLVSDIKLCGYVSFDGFGASVSCDWSEQSFFVIDPSDDFLSSVFTKYNQDAFVIVKNNSMVDLVMNPNI